MGNICCKRAPDAAEPSSAGRPAAAPGEERDPLKKDKGLDGGAWWDADGFQKAPVDDYAYADAFSKSQFVDYSRGGPPYDWDKGAADTEDVHTASAHASGLTGRYVAEWSILRINPGWFEDEAISKVDVPLNTLGRPWTVDWKAPQVATLDVWVRSSREPMLFLRGVPSEEECIMLNSHTRSYLCRSDQRLGLYNFANRPLYVEGVYIGVCERPRKGYGPMRKSTVTMDVRWSGCKVEGPQKVRQIVMLTQGTSIEWDEAALGFFWTDICRNSDVSSFVTRCRIARPQSVSEFQLYSSLLKFLLGSRGMVKFMFGCLALRAPQEDECQELLKALVKLGLQNFKPYRHAEIIDFVQEQLTQWAGVSNGILGSLLMRLIEAQSDVCRQVALLQCGESTLEQILEAAKPLVIELKEYRHSSRKPEWEAWLGDLWHLGLTAAGEVDFFMYMDAHPHDDFIVALASRGCIERFQALPRYHRMDDPEVISIFKLFGNIPALRSALQRQAANMLRDSMFSRRTEGTEWLVNFIEQCPYCFSNDMVQGSYCSRAPLELSLLSSVSLWRLFLALARREGDDFEDQAFVAVRRQLRQTKPTTEMFVYIGDYKEKLSEERQRVVEQIIQEMCQTHLKGLWFEKARAAFSHERRQELNTVDSMIADLSEQRMSFIIAKDWMVEWSDYCKNQRHLPPGPVYSPLRPKAYKENIQPVSPAVWQYFLRKYSMEATGVLVSHEYTGKDEVWPSIVEWPSEVCQAVDVLTREELHKLLTLEKSMPEDVRPVLLPEAMAALLNNCRMWLESVMAGEVSASTVESLRLDHVHRCPGLTLELVDALSGPEGVKEELLRLWTAFGEAEKLMKMFQSVAQRCSQVINIDAEGDVDRSGALVKLSNAYRARFSGSAKDAEANPEWNALRELVEPVTRLGTLLKTRLFLSFCQRSDMMHARLARGLEWERVPLMLEHWDEAVKQYLDTHIDAEQMEKLLDAFGIEGAWDEKSAPLLSRELQQIFGGALADALQFYLLAKQAKKYVKSILEFMERLHEYFPSVPCSGDLIDLLRSFMESTGHGLDAKSQANISKVGREMLGAWGSRRHEFCKTLTNRLPEVKAAHEALESKNFDDLRRIINSLPGFVEEQQVFESLFDVRATLQPFFEPETHFPNVEAVLNWLSTPSEEEMTRFENAVGQLDHYLEVFNNVVREWTTDEYERCIEQIDKALATLQVELRPDMEKLQDVSLDSVDDWLVFHCPTWTTDWTPFSEMKMVEYRMFLYGEPKEEDRSKVETFHALISAAEQLARFHVRMLQGGFADSYGELRLVDLDTKKDGEDAAEGNVSKVVHELTGVVRELQSTLEEQEAALVAHGGTFLPTGTTAQLLAALRRGPLGEQEVAAYAPVFDLAGIEIPDTGTRAEQMIALDGELRKRVIKQKQSTLKTHAPLKPLNSVRPGKVHLIVTEPKRCPLLQIVIALYAELRQRMPRWYELLIYAESGDCVNLDEARAFASRMAHPCQEDDMFVICGWSYAPRSHWTMFREWLDEHESARQASIFLTAGPAKAVKNPHADCTVLAELCDATAAVNLKQAWANLWPQVQTYLNFALVVDSQVPGSKDFHAGKSYRISKRDPAAQRVSLFHYFRPHILLQSLRGIYAVDDDAAVWINISANCPADAEATLLQLLVCGIVLDPRGTPVALDRKRRFIIELPRKRGFPFCREVLPKERIGPPAVELESTLPEVQVVCKYLRELDKPPDSSQLLCKDAGQKDFKADEAPAAGHDECVKLLRQFGPKFRGQPAVDGSMTTLMQFMRYLSGQLRRLETSTVYFLNMFMADMSRNSRKLKIVTVGRLVNIAATMFEAAIDSETFELSTGWDEATQDPMIFLSRRGELTLSVFLAPGKKDAHFNWTEFGFAEIDREDSRRAKEMLDRCMCLPKKEVRLEAEVTIFMKNDKDKARLDAAISADLLIQNDVRVCGESLRRGYRVTSHTPAQFNDGTFPKNLTFSTTQLTELKNGLGDDMVATTEMNLGGVRVLPGMALCQDVVCVDDSKKSVTTKADLDNLELPVTMIFLEASALQADQGYVLTMDNVLKMILISQRLDNGPVLLMGETGCGKTSLVTYLCKVANIDLHALDVHGGIDMNDVRQFMDPVLTHALRDRNRHVWIFLDELNTSPCIDVFAEMLCEGRFDGKPLPDNVRVLGACNPYRKSSAMSQPGQLMKSISGAASGPPPLDRSISIQSQADEIFVYQVLPLPSALTDFIWDFGSLKEKERAQYVREMVEQHVPACGKALADSSPAVAEGEEAAPGKIGVALPDLVANAMKIVLRNEDPSCVSLRDARRSVVLASWFCKNKVGASHAAVLSTVVSFYYRLMTHGDREEFWQLVPKGLYAPYSSGREMLRAYQDGFTEVVHVPEGVARNDALTSNIFVMLTAVANRIPVLVVGKPGQSKTLAVSLLGSGRTSTEVKTTVGVVHAPLLSVLSYQCSEHTTADSLDHHFVQGEQLQQKRGGGGGVMRGRGVAACRVQVVIFLDEVGLAEKNTTDRPLKVLHKHLENPSVGFIGLSNTPLDASKMNRAIYLSHLDPGPTDLKSTARVMLQKSGLREQLVDDFAESTSQLFLQVLENLNRHKDGAFTHLADHRGFYNLIKGLVRLLSEDALEGVMLKGQRDVCDLVLRNLGGVPVEDVDGLVLAPMRKVGFGEAVQHWRETAYPENAQRMMAQNLSDPISRHLMIIAPSEVRALHFLFSRGLLESEEAEVFFGSSFPEDAQSKLYIFRLLSKIRMCMEIGKKVVLLNLGRLHESLYEVLNQQYIYFNGKPTCRIALGAESRQVPVHKDFRCIVVLTKREVHQSSGSDAHSSLEMRFLSALLSRFEKVVLDDESELPSHLLPSLAAIRTWSSGLGPTEVFPGAGDDAPALMLRKLLREAGEEAVISPEDAERGIQKRLVDMMPAYHILKTAGKLGEMVEEYVHDACHESLEALLAAARSNHKIAESSLIVRTYDEQDVEGIASDLPLIILALRDFSTEYTFTRALARDLPQIAEGGTLVVDCVEGEVSPAMLQHVQRLAAAALRDLPPAEDTRRMLFLLRQQPFMPVPSATTDFGDEWQHYWVETVTKAGSLAAASSPKAKGEGDTLILTLADLLLPPAALGDQLGGVVCRLLTTFNVCSYVEYPATIAHARPPQEVVDRLLGDEVFLRFMTQQLVPALMEDPKMQSWLGLLSKENPFGVHEPVVEAALHALEVRVHEVFAELWCVLDMDANADTFSDGFVRQLWLGLALNPLLVPLDMTHKSVMKRCSVTRIIKNVRFPFAGHIIRQFRRLDAQLWVHLSGGELSESPDARWTRAYRWLSYQMLQVLHEPAEPVLLPSDWKDHQEQLLDSCVRAAAPGTEHVVRPVAKHFLGREVKVPKTGFELLRRVAVSSWVARSALLRDEALEAAIKSVLAQEGRLRGFKPDARAEKRDDGRPAKATVEQTLQQLLLRAVEILTIRARAGEFVTMAEFAHAEKILHVACPDSEDKTLSDLAESGSASANLLVRLSAYADLVLRFYVPAEQVEGAKFALQSWAIFLLGGEGEAAPEQSVDARILADMRRVNDNLDIINDASPAAYIPVTTWVAQRLCAAASRSTETHEPVTWPTLPDGMLKLMARRDFPELVAVELLRHLILDEVGAKEMDKLLLVLTARAGDSLVDRFVELGKQPLARALVIRFEQALGSVAAGGEDSWAVDLKYPFMSSLKSIAQARLALRDLRDEVRSVLCKKPPPDDRGKVTVRKFAELANSLEPNLIKAWGLESLNNEFGEETLTSEALVVRSAGDGAGDGAEDGAEDGAVKMQHLLEPEFFQLQSVANDPNSDKVVRLPVVGRDYKRIVRCMTEKAGLAEACAELRTHPCGGLVLNMVGFTALRKGISFGTEDPREIAKKFIDQGIMDAAEGQVFATLLGGTAPYCNLLREAEVDIARLVAASTAAALSASRDNDNGLLREFMVNAEKFKQRYVWSMSRIKYYDQLHDIRVSEMARRLEDTRYIPIYECPNGHPYWLGNCARPAVTYTCSMCKEQIGGKSYRLVDGNRQVPRTEWKLPQKGFCYSRWASSSAHLRPRAFLALQFWTHAVLLGSLLLNLFNESTKSAKAFLPHNFPYSKDSLPEDLLNCLRWLLEALVSENIAPANFESRSDAVDYLLMLFMDIRSWTKVFNGSMTLDNEAGLRKFEDRFNECADAPRELKEVKELKKHTFVPKSVLSRASVILNLPSSQRFRSFSLLDALPQLEAKASRCRTFWQLHGSWRTLLYCAELPKLLRLPRILFESFSGRLSKVEAIRMPLRDALGERCGTLWNDFATAWNNVKDLLTRVECAEVRLEELDPEKPAESLELLVNFEQNLGLQLWNLVTTISKYQNDFLDALGRDTAASVPALNFERRFAVPLSAFAGGEAGGAGDTWAVDVVPCAFRIDQAGRWNFNAEAFELMSRAMIAPLVRIVLEPKPTFEFVALPGDDWQRMLNEALPQEALSSEVALAVSKGVVPGGPLSPELAQMLLMLVTKMVHQILGGVRANPKLKIAEFAQSHAGAAMKRKAAGYQILFKRIPELIDVRLCHLSSLWEFVFEHFEPNYPEIVHVIFQADMKDEDQYGLWHRLQAWPKGEVRALRMWFKILLGDRLIEDSFPEGAPASHMLYAVAESHPVATAGNAPDRLLDDGPEGFLQLPVGQALAAYRVVIAAFEGEETEGVQREKARIAEEQKRIDAEAEEARAAAEAAEAHRKEQERLAAIKAAAGKKGAVDGDLEAQQERRIENDQPITLEAYLEAHKDQGDIEQLKEQWKKLGTFEEPPPPAKGACCNVL